MSRSAAQHSVCFFGAGTKPAELPSYLLHQMADAHVRLAAYSSSNSDSINNGAASLHMESVHDPLYADAKELNEGSDAAPDSVQFVGVPWCYSVHQVHLPIIQIQRLAVTCHLIHVDTQSDGHVHVDLHALAAHHDGT
jgi:hypothetical protein